MKRISKKVKAIADAHIEAKITGKFSEQHVTNKSELLDSIVQGYTYKQLLYLVEVNYVSTTSQLLSSLVGHVTDAYRKQVYKGFKEILKEYNL
jgi:Tfp pilus assembly protein PilW